MEKSLIKINNCRIEKSKGTVLERLDWEMKAGEAWLVIGPNGGGKADFLQALDPSFGLKIVPNLQTSCEEVPLYSNLFEDSVETVSLERAARLIQQEREEDESEFVEGGVDIGRTGRVFIAEGLVGRIKKGSKLPELCAELDAYPEIKLCGVQKILDRGLKYMSTGEIRRTLLARSLISKKKLLLLSDPFAGLDAESRSILLDFFDTIAGKQLKETNNDSTFPRIILSMERYVEIPDAITHVIEFSEGKVSFCGLKSEYEKIVEKKNAEAEEKRREGYAEFAATVKELSDKVQVVMGIENYQPESDILVDMTDVNVGWGDHQVLRHLTWRLNRGEHWLVRGPNGSGKTTFMELITGDNMQVFSNDIKIFGARRGSGETIWDIKHRLGIVSYRLHVEYRMLGGTKLRDVIISGFHDSIGLYEASGEVEAQAAEKWLSLGGFAGRGDETFGNLSYGEQRAILILRGAVKCPPIMILDEPCHGLDEQMRTRILDLLELIAESGTTTFLHVTHEPSEVLKCEKHVLELHPEEDPMYRIFEQ